MRIQPIVPGVYQISLAWSNAYLLTDGSDAALIDTGLHKDREALRSALQEVGIAEGHVRAVYLTHGHCDHAGNAAYFVGVSPPTENRADLYAHRDEARTLEPPRQTYVPRGLGLLAHPFAAVAFAVGEALYPVERCPVAVKLAEGDLIEAPGGPLRVLSSPGHTPGHVAYYRERDGILFSGDAILNIVPVRRVTGLSLPMALFTEDMALAKRSARRLADLRPTLLLAGHGRPLVEDTARRLQDWAQTLD
jgi:glyoxylase-like metal-dependent hydrolase (beta-lactamase superfamily II)